MKRIYIDIIEQHFAEHDQMLFLAGPRQVGKTTIGQFFQQCYSRFLYLNFDIAKHRELIISGVDAVLKDIDYHSLFDDKPMLVLDELHKYKHWKNFLKGLYDEYHGKIHILVMGSAKLNIYQKGGDSLMGRYFLYRVHPLTVAEVLDGHWSQRLISPPKPLALEQFSQLLIMGGFPNPYLKNTPRFSMQWRRLRRQQLLNEDIRSLKQVHDISHIEMLATLLRHQSGQHVNYSNLAKALKVSVDTVSRWVAILEEFYYCFKVTPWFQNVKRSLVKEPKIYLWDWSEISDRGGAIENMVASHLNKAVNLWTDYGLGEFRLHYLRDKDKREVDFIVIKNGEPWFLIEVKSSEKNAINAHLHYFQQQLNVPHAFQLSFNKPYVDIDCFTATEPVIVPMVTFLSQLV